MLRIRSPILSPSSRKGEAICGGKKCETNIAYCSYCYNSNSLCGSTIKYSNHNKKSTGNFFSVCVASDMGNQGKMAGNPKICIGIQSQLILAEFIYMRCSF